MNDCDVSHYLFLCMCGGSLGSVLIWILLSIIIYSYVDLWILDVRSLERCQGCVKDVLVFSLENLKVRRGLFGLSFSIHNVWCVLSIAVRLFTFMFAGEGLSYP